MTRRNSFFWLIAAAAVTYAALSPRFYVGSFGDDARDILAAQSILHGSYSDLQQPGHPPLNLPLPGFFAPACTLGGSYWTRFRISTSRSYSVYYRVSVPSEKTFSNPISPALEPLLVVSGIVRV